MKKYLYTLLALLMVNLHAEKSDSRSVPTLPNTSIKPLKNWNTSLYAGNEIGIIPALGVLTRDKGMNVEFDFRAGAIPMDVYGIEASCSKLFTYKYHDNRNYYMGLGAGAMAGSYKLSVMGSSAGRVYIAAPTAKVFVGSSSENYFLDVGFDAFTTVVTEIPVPVVRVGITL